MLQHTVTHKKNSSTASLMTQPFHTHRQTSLLVTTTVPTYTLLEHLALCFMLVMRSSHHKKRCSCRGNSDYLKDDPVHLPQRFWCVRAHRLADCHQPVTGLEGLEGRFNRDQAVLIKPSVASGRWVTMLGLKPK